MSIEETFGKLRAAYTEPDDLKKIEEEEKRVTELLQLKAFSELEVTKTLIDLCRTDILYARKALATNRNLDDLSRSKAFAVIDARQWFLSMVVQDFESELANIQAQLENDLQP